VRSERRHAERRLLAGLFLCALPLRGQIVAIGPLLPDIRHDLRLSHAVAGLLVTIPVVCMGVFAPPAAYLLRRGSVQRAITLCLILIGVGGVLRALVPAGSGVLVLTLLPGIGAGLAGTLFPVAVKERIPDQPALGTGVYVIGLAIGASSTAALAVPLDDALGGWRYALIVISAASLAVLPLWIVLGRSVGGAHRVTVGAPHLPLRSPVAWALVIVFATQSLVFYGINSWLAPAFTERGWSQVSAGALVAIFNGVSLAGALAVSNWADRGVSRRTLLLASAIPWMGCIVGLVLVPGSAWAWCALAGFMSGIVFTLALTLPLDVADDAAEAAAAAGMMLGVGYLISGIGPFALGAVRDAAGNFTSVMWILAALLAINTLASLPLTHERLRGGSRTRQKRVTQK
jgi:CP family cyanate transporter-like MFS transporter